MSGAPRFRPAVPEDRPRLDNLFEAVYGPSWRDHTASWRYLPPWDHRGRIWVAECDDRIVGAQPSHAITIRFEGNPIPGALFLDVMTHPEYRRRGVFSGVVEGLRTALHDDGVRVLLTTPNGVAGRGFQSLPAWRPVGELIPFVRLVRWSALLRRPSGGPAPANPDAPGPPGASPLPASADDTRATRLFERFAAWSGTCNARDGDFIRWRFGAHTRRPYRILMREGSGGWAALAVTVPRRLMHRPVLMLVDLMAVLPGNTELQGVLRDVTDEAERLGVGAVVSYLSPGSPLVPSLRQAGFWPIPRRLRPRPYAVWMATDLERGAAIRIGDLSRWHMTPADSDLV